MDERLFFQRIIEVQSTTLQLKPPSPKGEGFPPSPKGTLKWDARIDDYRTKNSQVLSYAFLDDAEQISSHVGPNFTPFKANLIHSFH